MDDGILTGEGVLLDARPASFASRMLGIFVDLVALAVVIVGGMLVVVWAGVTIDSGYAVALSILLVVTVMVGIPTTVETLTRGRSLGKLAAGIRIVRDDGGPIRFRQAFVRALTGVGELWLTFGSVALICSLVHPHGKRVGDILAGTYAVRLRGAVGTPPPVPLPWELMPWARSADIRRLPDGIALTSRQFLARTASLHPASRAQLGAELAAEVSRYVAPPPPAGTHPEAFLAAVIAERRDRELAVAMSSADRVAAEAGAMRRLPHGVPDPEN